MESSNWADPVSLMERERLRQKPTQRALMRQVWRHLLFAHFPVEPKELAHVVPEGLDLDLHPDANGEPKAWVGLVPFATAEVRPIGLPPMPGIARFDEINVRTYVHRGGQDPSVLFLSLDGGPWLIRSLAWTYYKVPYVKSDTRLWEEDGAFNFESDRGREDGLGKARLRYRPLQPLPPLEPGTLEYFLLERYQILAPYAGRLYRARIFHAPYQAFSVEVLECESSLPETHAIQSRRYSHFLYSDQVRTTFFPPTAPRP